MTNEASLSVLRASKLAADLDEQECRLLSGLVQIRELAPGEVLAREGTADNHLYVVASGNLDVIRYADVGTRLPIATLSEGDLADELNFIDGMERQTSLVAQGPARVLALERERLESLLATHPAIVYHVMRAIIRTAHQTQRRLSLQAVELMNYVYKQHGRY
jgi:CRP-like cAMP-binding protein